MIKLNNLLLAASFYLMLPQVVGYIANPYLGLLYSGAVTTYTAYDALNNAYKFYLESVESHDLRREIIDDDSMEIPLFWPSESTYEPDII